MVDARRRRRRANSSRPETVTNCAPRTRFRHPVSALSAMLTASAARSSANSWHVKTYSQRNFGDCASQRITVGLSGMAASRQISERVSPSKRRSKMMLPISSTGHKLALFSFLVIVAAHAPFAFGCIGTSLTCERACEHRRPMQTSPSPQSERTVVTACFTSSHETGAAEVAPTQNDCICPRMIAGRLVIP
jgi:hypothetical protein